AATAPGGVASYQSDPLDRLVGATAPAGAATRYRYDALGSRLQQVDPAGTTDRLVDPFGAGGLAQVLRESDGAGAVLADYVYGAELLSMARPGGVSFVLPDGQLSTRALADAAGGLTDRFDYDAFGDLLRRTGATPASFLY